MTKEKQIKRLTTILKNNSVHTEPTSDGWILTIQESKIPSINDDILNGFADVVSRWVSVEDKLPEKE